MPKTVSVLLLGDSTMYGYDSFTKSQANPSPERDPQVEMDARFDVGAVHLGPNAVVGSSSALVNGTNGYQAFPQDIAADILVLNYGINHQDAVIGELVAEYEANSPKIAATSPTPLIIC